jgi:dipeptidyl-peptidase 4
MPRSLARLFALLFVLSAGASAQAPRRVLTNADYDRAVKMLAPSLAGLAVGGDAQVTWLADGRFWYRSATPTDTQLVIIDPARKTRSPLYNAPAVATALSAASGGTFTPAQLPTQTLTLSAKGDSVAFDANGRRWTCDVKGTRCVPGGAPPPAGGGRGGRGGGRGGRGGGGRNIDRVCGPNVTGAPLVNGIPSVASPDGSKLLYICDWNLWVRDATTGQDRQLTTDGLKDFGYATNNAGWASGADPRVAWSPDGSKIATQQQDERHVGEMYLVQTPVSGGHPVLREWKYPLPGDSVVAMIHRVIIDVNTGKVTRLQMPPDVHRAMIGDDISMADYVWSPDATRLIVASTDRFHKSATIRMADVATGAVKTLFTESEKTHFEARVPMQVLWATNELLWYSQRDNWGQIYLYDLNTGTLKNKITSGVGPVTQIARVDEKTRTMWYGAVGREPGQDPYFLHFYRIGLDGKNNVSLTPDVGTHAIQLSADGKYLVDTYSSPDVAPVSGLRDATNGKLVMSLEKADVSRLVATGWKPPIPVHTMAANGRDTIYGMLFRPTNFDSTKKYPIINNAYPGPQSGSVGSRAFSVARGDKQALAELGFIVLSIDGTGTPDRSKSFHDAYYGAMGRDNTIPDQIAAMKELATRYSWIDINKAAMWGHSGGGFITADAMLRPPYNEFFKVGISESGNHDQRQYEDDWGERYQGPLIRNPDGSDNYDIESNQSQAKNLKGHLFLIHGTMDNNVPPYNTLLVVDALTKAGKDFDLLMVVNSPHGYIPANYVMRRRWDYFVRYLLDAEPPHEYVIPSPGPGGRGRGGAPD